MTLADKTTREFFLESGAYDRERFGAHTHSTTCVMSSLAQLADLLDDAKLLARVRAFYDNGLWEIRDEIGWVIESSRDDAVADRGEINNTGDIVETALILGRRGFPSTSRTPSGSFGATSCRRSSATTASSRTRPTPAASTTCTASPTGTSAASGFRPRTDTSRWTRTGTSASTPTSSAAGSARCARWSASRCGPGTASTA